jgi:hypothetical protein
MVRASVVWRLKRAGESVRPCPSSSVEIQAAHRQPRGAGEAGSATLYAIGLLALCSMFIAMQLSILDAQNMADNIGVRSLNARRVSTASIGFVSDMLERGHIVRSCVDGKVRLAVAASAPRDVAKSVASRFDTAKQTFRFVECDPLHLPDADLMALAKSGGKGVDCPRLQSTVAVTGTPCKKGAPLPTDLRVATTVEPAVAKRDGARTTAEAQAEAALLAHRTYTFKALLAAAPPAAAAAPAASPDPRRGCKYTCHVNPETGKQVRTTREGWK